MAVVYSIVAGLLGGVVFGAGYMSGMGFLPAAALAFLTGNISAGILSLLIIACVPRDSDHDRRF